jgi:hypothetical protein
MNTTIPTSHGNLTPEQIVEHLTYQSYAHNRDLGSTHESLVRIGVGTESRRIRYENEKQTINN